MINELQQNYIEIITNRYINSLIGMPNEQGCRLSFNQNILDTIVHKELSTQIVDKSHNLFGSWGEIDKDRLMDLAHGGAVLKHLYNLALGWKLDCTKHSGDKEIEYRLQIAWDFYSQFVYPGCPFPINWWAWEIGIPWTLTDIYLIAGNAFRAEQKENLKQTIEYLINNVRYDLNILGANGIWMAFNYLRGGLITGNVDYIDKATRWIQSVHKIEHNDEGIQIDYSYKYHGSTINMGYGCSHFHDIGLFIYLVYDTPWMLSEEKYKLFSDWCLNFVKWTIYKNGIDPFIIDRNATRGDKSCQTMAETVIGGAIFAAQTNIPGRDEIIEFVRREIKAGFTGYNEFTVSEVKRLNKDAYVLKDERIIKYWPEVEYMISYRPEYYASIKMSSVNTKGWQSIWDENLKGWHTSDGQIVIKVKGDEYRNNVLPTMDWDRLSGITRCESFTTPAETLGHSPFVCGTTSEDCEVGCCGMDFQINREDGRTLKAKKSYFIIDDMIIALGSDIFCDSESEVETIIRNVVVDEAREQQPLLEESINPLLVQGTDCMYIFPEDTAVYRTLRQRDGKWRDINHIDSAINVNGDHGETIHIRMFETIIIPHGIKPNGAGYAVIYLPARKASHINPDDILKRIKIERKDKHEHRIYDTLHKCTLKILWGNGAVIERE